MSGPRGCQGCGCLSYDEEWDRAFGVRLCGVCKQEDDLMSKGNAKELYLLTDSDFKKLGSLAKANPKHKDWVAMRLYLESQVRGAAHTKYGGEQGIKDRRAKQLATQAERRTKKRTQELDKKGQEARKLQRIRDRIDSEAAAPSVQPGSTAGEELL